MACRSLELVGTLFLLLLASCGADGKKETDPAQANMYVRFQDGSDERVGLIFAETAKKNNLQIQFNTVSFGSHKGTQRVYSIFNNDTMARLQSSIDDPCMSEKDLAQQRLGYPVFSDKIFFLSIFSRTVPGDREKVRKFAYSLMTSLKKYDVVVSQGVGNCDFEK